MGRSPEDYARLRRPPSVFMRGYQLLYWCLTLVFGYAWLILGTFIIVLDTWDRFFTKIKIYNWSWPVAIISLMVVWAVGAFVIWLASSRLKSLSKPK